MLRLPKFESGAATRPAETSLSGDAERDCSTAVYSSLSGDEETGRLKGRLVVALGRREQDGSKAV